MLHLAGDVETTGLPNWRLPSEHPDQPRMCQLALALFDDEGRILIEHEGLILPAGWEIPPETTRVHGLTTETCLKVGKPLELMLAEFNILHDKADDIVAYNTAFDLKILRGELARCGFSKRYGERPTLDLMPACTPLCNLPPSDAMMATGRRGRKTAKLAEATRILLGQTHDRAHDAMADVRAVVALWLYLKNHGKLPAAKIAEPRQPNVMPGSMMNTRKQGPDEPTDF